MLGGTRFIGRAVVDALQRRGVDVAKFHRNPAHDAAEIPTFLGDRHEFPASAQEAVAWMPDVVVDMLSLGEADTRQTIETFTGIAKRHVLVSSIDVYRAFGALNGSESWGGDLAIIDEGAPLRENLYPYRGRVEAAWAQDYDKIPAEQLALAAEELPGTVVRLPMVFGPRDYQARTWSLQCAMRPDTDQIQIGERFSQWIGPRGYVANIGEAIALCAIHPSAPGRAYVAADEVEWTNLEWAERIAGALDWMGDIVVVPDEIAPEEFQWSSEAFVSFRVSIDRIRGELGYRPIISPDEGLQHTVRWFEDNPPS